MSGARTRGDAFTAFDAEDVPELKRPKAEEVALYLDYCTPARAARINLAITKFIVGCAIAFNVVNSVFFLGVLHEHYGAGVRAILPFVPIPMSKCRSIAATAVALAVNIWFYIVKPGQLVYIYI